MKIGNDPVHIYRMFYRQLPFYIHTARFPGHNWLIVIQPNHNYISHCLFRMKYSNNRVETCHIFCQSHLASKCMCRYYHKIMALQVCNLVELRYRLQNNHKLQSNVSNNQTFCLQKNVRFNIQFKNSVEEFLFYFKIDK